MVLDPSLHCLWPRQYTSSSTFRAHSSPSRARSTRVQLRDTTTTPTLCWELTLCSRICDSRDQQPYGHDSSSGGDSAPDSMVLSGLDLYGAVTVLSILRYLCKNGLVDPKDFFLHATQVRRLTITLWDAKELEELTRKVRRRPISSGLSQPQKIHAHGRRRLRGWLERLRSR